MQPSLVVLGNTLTALAVVRDARKRGLDPILVDKVWGIACHTRCARLDMIDAWQPESQHLAQLVLLGNGGTNYLIATGDAWVRFIVRHRAALDAAYARVLHAKNDVLETCLNKTRFAQWCRENDVPAPNAWFPSKEARPEKLELPLFVRPAETLHDWPFKGIPKATQVLSEASLVDWLRRYAEFGVEPLVTESLLGQPLIQYSVAVAISGNQTLSFVTEKVRPAPEACSVGTYVRLSSAPAIEASVLSALEKLNYFGIAEVEVLYAPETDRHVIIEINARPWLQYGLAPVAGYDFLGSLICNSPARSRSNTDASWLNWRDDLYVCWSRSVGLVRRKEVSLFAYVRSILSASTYAVYSPEDLTPLLARWFRLRAPAMRRRSNREHADTP